MAKTQPDEQYIPQGDTIPIDKPDNSIANVRKVIEAEPHPITMGEPSAQTLQ